MQYERNAKTNRCATIQLFATYHVSNILFQRTWVDFIFGKALTGNLMIIIRIVVPGSMKRVEMFVNLICFLPFTHL